MYLQYKNTFIPVTTTHNKTILKYHFQKLYYAIIIYDCNRYSSIANKQRIDVVMTDNSFNVLSVKREMHENTVYENKEANITILLPLNIFDNIEVNTSFKLVEKQKDDVLHEK